ncbi:MAG TPA: glutathione S-transferase family protein [Hyphomonadaceae bacterium]|jgi:glutathione S-transferase|nr:glutathione S-transferase family protein [Hyphomonadaceae bacterium]
MKIYGVPLSVHTRKVIIAAKVKDIPLDVEVVIPVIPDNPPPNWKAISPTGLIPVIDDDGFILQDSTAIVLYLERKKPTPALLPADAKDYATALSLDAWAGGVMFNRIIHPVFHNQVVNPNIRKVPGDAAAIDKALTQVAPEAFSYLEGLSPETFFVGDRLSIADIAVVSNLILFHYLGYRIDPKRFPKLAAFFRNHIESSSLQSVLAAEKPFVEQMGLDRSWL